MGITGGGNYFEDFGVGDVYEHVRGRTVTNFDNYAVTHMSLNTAQAHFNLVYSKQALDGRLSERIVAGPCTIALVVGLTSEDMSENTFADIGLTGIRLPNPVFAGDTLHARSEVLKLEPDALRSDSGIMRYRFIGTNQDGKVVAEGERIVRVKKRASWAEADGNAARAAATNTGGSTQ